jgi:ACS family hexuronate transporter-like MFS transporter
MGQEPSAAPPGAPAERTAWKWWVCTLLLLATTLNYMDRQALAQTSKRISTDFGLNDFQYSYLIAAFNIGFGIGALFIGYLIDRGNLRWIYAVLVLGWSLAGFATGFATGFVFLLACRLVLGMFEAGNWPCGIMTVKRVMRPEERALGNGMFQSGTALGAIIIPLVVYACFKFSDPDDLRAWQLPFRIIGAAGVLWVLLWLLTVRPERIATLPAPAPTERLGGSYWDLWRDRRFYVMTFVIVAVNVPWRSFGEWLPKFLQNSKGYSETEAQLFSSAYFFAADVGSIASGLLVLRLARGGRSVFSSRMVSFFICASLTTLSVAVVLLPPGTLLFVALLLIAFGALGSFSSYFAFSQEVSAKHQGKVTGTLGLINSGCMALLGLAQGWLIRETGSYTIALGLTGLAPLAGALALYLFWDRPKVSDAPSS